MNVVWDVASTAVQAADHHHHRATKEQQRDDDDYYVSNSNNVWRTLFLEDENASSYCACPCAAAVQQQQQQAQQQQQYSLLRSILRHAKRGLVRLLPPSSCQQQQQQQGHGFLLLLLIGCCVLAVALLLGFALGYYYCASCARQQQQQQKPSEKNDLLGNSNHPFSKWTKFSSLSWLQFLSVAYGSTVEFVRCNLQRFLGALSFVVGWRRNETTEQPPSVQQRIHIHSSKNAKRSRSSEGVAAAAAAAAAPKHQPAIAAFDDNAARTELQTSATTERESGLTDAELPQHIAVIMDGNRRYGVERCGGNPWAGHWHGSRRLLEFARWCLAERVPELTVFAFSTENWHRDAAEVARLMQLIVEHCRELRAEAATRRIEVRVHSTDAASLPAPVREALRELQQDDSDQQQQQHQHPPDTGDGADESVPNDNDNNNNNNNNPPPPRLRLNICLSYGSRGEIVQACQAAADDYKAGALSRIDEAALARRLLVGSDPDLLIRTSGEVRLSNFLLWQLAYAELFFVDKKWPELEKADLVDILRSFARGRQRRFGK